MINYYIIIFILNYYFQYYIIYTYERNFFYGFKFDIGSNQVKF